MFCPNCEQEQLTVFHEIEGVPTNSCILLDSPDAARNYPRGSIRLGFCQKCGFISNTAFDSRLTEYSDRYEETQGFSPTFNTFHERLGRRLVDRYGLNEKRLVEIGCGKGEFLALLCELGDNHGVGFDPGYLERRLPPPIRGNVEFVKDFYSEKYAAFDADFVCCKMTLEHIHPTGDFLRTVRRSIGPREGVITFFQIPDATRIVSTCAFEDVYYEHCSYFTPPSLAQLFEQNGFQILHLGSEYEGQYLTIEAVSNNAPERLPGLEPDVEEIGRQVAAFPSLFQEKVTTWRARLALWRRQGRRVVLWGSGSKGVSFLTTLGVGEEIDYVVDINPFRQGFFMSGTGHRIVGPEFLRNYRPETVVLMNAIYKDEVRKSLGEMGLRPEIIPL